MSSTRFELDPTRIFPDHAYAPGYEPTSPPPEPPTPVFPAGDLIGFVTAAGLVLTVVALVSTAILWM